jgi:peptidoglycan-binding domain 1 protein|nr:MAG TPA: transcriptional regulator [Caudoviricetes sp.]
MTALKAKTRAAVLQIAEWQLGVVEMPTNSNKVKYNTAYYGREVSGGAYAWCMAFTWWVFREAGFNLYKTARCSAFVQRYRTAAPAQVVTSGYKPGDIVFFDFSGKRKKTEHVGIVVGVVGNTILTIEGNTGTGNDANGGAVMKRRRDVSLITCGIRPGYPDPA